MGEEINIVFGEGSLLAVQMWVAALYKIFAHQGMMKGKGFGLFGAGLLAGLAIGYAVSLERDGDPVQRVHAPLSSEVQESYLRETALASDDGAEVKSGGEDASELAALREENEALREENQNLYSTLASVAERVLPEPPPYLAGDVYERALDFYQDDGVFVDPLQILDFLEEAATAFNLYGGEITSDRNKVSKKVLFEEPWAGSAAAMEVWGQPANEHFSLSFWLPDERYHDSRFNKKDVHIHASFYPDSDDPGFYNVKIGVRATRLPGWGEEKQASYSAKGKQGVYRFAQLRGVSLVESEGAELMFRTKRERFEDLDEEMKKRYAEGTIYGEINRFCEFVKSLVL